MIKEIWADIAAGERGISRHKLSLMVNNKIVNTTKYTIA